MKKAIIEVKINKDDTIGLKIDFVPELELKDSTKEDDLLAYVVNKMVSSLKLDKNKDNQNGNK
ncbi:MAG: hypothetical protein ACTSYG_07635 [Candidatus Heimdallarchaeota archaeon]